MPNPTLVVMAAGMGSRYGGLKQIDPVGPSGELVIDYSIFDALRSGFKKIVFIIRKDIEKPFRESIGTRIEKQAAVEYVFQEREILPRGFVSPETRAKPWGTGHAVLMAREKIQEPFGVINADDFYGLNSYQVLGEYLQQPMPQGLPEYVVVGFQLEKTLSEFGSVTRGVCQTDAKGYLTQIWERFKISRNNTREIFDTEPDGTLFPLTGKEPVSMNMWGFYPSVFGLIEELFIDFLKKNLQEPKTEFFLPSLIGDLVKQNRIKVKTVSTSEEWFGVTYPEDKPVVVQRIQKLIEQKRYPSRLWES